MKKQKTPNKKAAKAKTKKKGGLKALGDLELISHELRTPLVSILGYLEMMLKGQLGELSEEQRRGMAIALRNCERLRDYVNVLILAIKEEDV